jgi:transposase
VLKQPGMYIKRRRNKSGSYSIQIVEKCRGKKRLLKTIGSGRCESRLKELEQEARDYISASNCQIAFDFTLEEEDARIETYFNSGNVPVVKAKGPEIILGRIFDRIGFSKIKEELFKALVLARLTYPVSKLKTTEYLLTHHQKEVSIDSIYRFLDRFHTKYKARVEELAFEHSKFVLGGEVRVVFYDMTTLYFESEDEDDLRKIGFSKDGKFQHPQIMLGLLVGENGYPICYDIYEGNTFEGHTLIPAIESAQKRFNIAKPIVIADSGMLSHKNLDKLVNDKYLFIIGARIKSESVKLREEILEKTKNIKDGQSVEIGKGSFRLIVNYSEKRAKKDASNRKAGIKRLTQRITAGRLTKNSINVRGYNKFLKLESEVKVSLDEAKVEEDSLWDGLKGYITNSGLSSQNVISNYNHLWKIERAFRISKTDLRIRPIYHRKKDRIEAHICIAFAAYAVFKELERQILIKKINLSPQKVIEAAKGIYEVQFRLPKSRKKITMFNKLSNNQKLILENLK